MDPNANLERQLELAGEILARSDDTVNESVELAECLFALHQWITKGGFLPADWEAPGAAQGRALWRLMAERAAAVEQLRPSPFDLPAGYWGVRFDDGFECGIAPNGDVSS